MMNFYEGLTIALSFFGLIGTGFSIVVWSKIEKAANDAEQAKKDASEKSEAVKDDLSEFKLHVARHHPVKDDLAALEGKIEGLFKAVFDKVDKISSDINNMGNTFRDMLAEKEDRKK